MTTGDSPVSRPEADPAGLDTSLASARAADDGPLLLEQKFGSGMLYGLRAAVLAHAVAAGMPEDRAGDVVIAVHELAANAVRHGMGAGRLRMRSRAGSLHCTVEDGEQQNWHEGRNVAAPWPYEYGHGLWLVRLLADQMSIVSGAGGTSAVIRFALPAVAGPDGAGERTMEVEVAAGAAGPVVMLSGQAGPGSADRLREVLVAQGQWSRQVTVEASELLALDPAAVWVLVVAAQVLRERGGSLVLLNPQPQVARMLSMTGADQAIVVRGPTGP
jgi:anti-anti-sigma factor